MIATAPSGRPLPTHTAAATPCDALDELVDLVDLHGVPPRRHRGDLVAQHLRIEDAAPGAGYQRQPRHDHVDLARVQRSEDRLADASAAQPRTAPHRRGHRERVPWCGISTALRSPSARGHVVSSRRSDVRPPRCGPSTTAGALALAVRDRMQDNRAASTQTSLDLGRKVTCYLSAEFLMGPQLGTNLLNLGIEDAARAALPELGPGPRRGPGLRGGTGPGQRRSRPAGRLLPGLARHPGAPRHRLRHPLRVRHLRPGDPRRLAGREDRQLAGRGNPWEIAKPDVSYLRRLGRIQRALRRRRRRATASGGCRAGC